MSNTDASYLAMVLQVLTLMVNVDVIGIQVNCAQWSLTAAADYHELSVPLWHDDHRGDQDALRRRWLDKVLPRSRCCAHSRACVTFR